MIPVVVLAVMMAPVVEDAITQMIAPVVVLAAMEVVVLVPYSSVVVAIGG